MVCIAIYVCILELTFLCIKPNILFQAEGFNSGFHDGLKKALKTDNSKKSPYHVIEQLIKEQEKTDQLVIR